MFTSRLALLFLCFVDCTSCSRVFVTRANADARDASQSVWTKACVGSLICESKGFQWGRLQAMRWHTSTVHLARLRGLVVCDLNHKKKAAEARYHHYPSLLAHLCPWCALCIEAAFFKTGHHELGVWKSWGFVYQLTCLRTPSKAYFARPETEKWT